jgi:methyl-accepting chemotaxis protein
MSRISLTYKLLLLSALSVVPAAVLLRQVYTTKSEAIDFAALEKKGNQLQKSLENVLQIVLQARFSHTRSKLDGSNSSAAIADIKTRMEQSLNELISTEARLGQDLQFTDEGLGKRKRQGLTSVNLQKKWTTLVETWSIAPNSVPDTAFTGLIADIRGMIAHAGDTSNLVLDPDLDSYYLMDVTLLALPQTQDHLQEMATFVESLLKAEQWTTDDRIQVAVFSDRLRFSDLDRINASAQTAFNEDPNFYGESRSLTEKLNPALAQHTDDMNRLLEILKAIQRGEKQKVSVTQFRKDLDAVIASNFALFFLSVEELDKLLSKRIDSISNNRLQALLLGVGVLLVTIMISIYMARLLSRDMALFTGKMQESGKQLELIGTEVLTASESLSSTSQDVASSLQETAASLEELSSIEKTNAEHAGRAAVLSKSCHDAFVKGESEMNRLMDSMQDITSSSKQIEAVIKVIEDIAFQTNLLALNAAVEAARAGDQGRGFAVVAEAVRTLAQRSATSAKDINRMIRDSGSKVQVGVSVAHSNVEILHSVVHAVKEISHLNNEISGACREQAGRLTMISQAMNQIDKSTQENALAAVQVAQASDGVSSQVKSLNHLVVWLKDMIEGKKAA